MVHCDGTEAEDRCMAIARKHAMAFEGTVFLVSAMSGVGHVPSQELDSLEKKLKRFAEDLFKPHGIACKTQVLLSNLSDGETLVQFCEQKGIDEIVMPVKYRSKLGKLVFGSTPQYVILEAPCVVITVK